MDANEWLAGRAGAYRTAPDAIELAMTLHSSAFECLKPTDLQLKAMEALRAAAKAYADAIEKYVHDGPDKTYILRSHRQTAMWANVSVTRDADGAPQ
jgi:hypothetical protein